MTTTSMLVVFLLALAVVPNLASAQAATITITQGAVTQGDPIRVAFSVSYSGPQTDFLAWDCGNGGTDRSILQAPGGSFTCRFPAREATFTVQVTALRGAAGERQSVGSPQRVSVVVRPNTSGGGFTVTTTSGGTPPAGSPPPVTPPPPLAGDPSTRAEDDGALNKLGGMLLQVVNLILGILFFIIHGLVWAFMAWVVVPLMDSMLTMKAADIVGIVKQGWGIVRNITNVLFILALIAIGLATILRLESYNYKRLLGKLILMALLVNFSLVIGQAVIQLADFATNTFIPQDFRTGSRVIEKLEQLRSMKWTDFFVDPLRQNYAESQFSITVKVIFIVIFEILLLVTFIVLSGYLVIRVVALWVLLILSPLAYLLSVLPPFASAASKWWSYFLKYAFFAPIMAFFLYLILNLRTDSIDVIQQFSGGDAQFNNIVKDNLQYAVIIVMLWIGMHTATRMSVAGAGGVMKFAQGVPKAGGRFVDRWTAGGAGKTAAPGAGRITRGWAAFRRGTSHFSPTAVKRGVQATLASRQAEHEKGFAAAAGGVQNVVTSLHPFATRDEKAIDYTKRARQARIAKKEADIDTNDEKILKAKYQDHLGRGEMEDAMAVSTRLMKNADFKEIIPAAAEKDFRGLRHVIEQDFKGLSKNIRDDFAQQLSDVAKTTSQPEFTRIAEGSYDSKTGKTRYAVKDSSQDGDIQNTIEKDLGKMSANDISKIRAGSYENEWLAKAARANIPNTQRDVNQISMVGTSMLLFKHGFDKALDENRGTSLRMLNKYASMSDDQLKTTIDRALGQEWLTTGTGPGGKSAGADYRDKIEVAISLKGVTAGEIDEYAEDLRNNKNWHLP